MPREVTDSTWLTDTAPSDRFPVYTRLNASDVLPDPITPLGATRRIPTGVLVEVDGSSGTVAVLEL
ncbi:hypothetical protein [Frankia sp. Cppng1_Ct_nod]|uniref:hypothetical protein n=1 Tax=Frankia sp. Cppng1_Ct_nod TaxID=2897162 RepID=UPI001040EA51|nr:hypothetical protein [Frankia sp. Cppng1_Ct_nod]